MRMGPFLIVLYVFNIVIGLLDKVLTPTLTGYQSISTGSTYLDILIQPWVWSQNTFLTMLVTSIFIISGITAAAAFLTRSDILTLAGVAGIFLSMGALPLVNMYSFVTRNIGQFACNPGDPCTAAAVIGSLTVGVIGLMYAFTVLEWWLWRPTTI
jgi:hypothetical protein